MKIYYFVSLLFVLFFFSIFDVGALAGTACAEASVSDISPSSVEIEEEFTVGIQIENCGDTVPEDLYFEIINPPHDIIIKEPLVIEIPTLLYSDSRRSLVYHMKSTSDAKPGIYEIRTRLSYGLGKFSTQKTYDFNVTVRGEEAELDLASVKTNPVLPREDDTVELTLRIENFGEGAANSVRVYADHPFNGIKESFIGTLDPDEDGPAILTFVVDKSGEFNFPIRISYKDDFGDSQINTDVSMIVLKKDNKVGVILLSIFILLIIAGLIFYYIRTKKAKDRIIQELLKGNHNDVSKKKRKRKK